MSSIEKITFGRMIKIISIHESGIGDAKFECSLYGQENGQKRTNSED